jgi:HK97 family phage major capsid protein
MSKYDVKKLKDERGQIVDEMTSIADRNRDKAEWNADDLVKFDELAARDTNLEKNIRRFETLNEKESQDEERNLEVAERSQKDIEQVLGDQKREVEVYDRYLRDALTNEDKQFIRAQTVTTTGGGYFIPTSLASEYIKSLQDFGGVRSVARIIPTATGNNLDFPTSDDTSNSASLLSINTGASESAFTLGTKQMNAYKYTTGKIIVPNELIQDSSFNIEQYVRELFVERMARGTNTAYTTGTGSAQPEGVVTGSSFGKLSAASTTTTFLELLDLKHSVDPAYRMNGSWMFNDNTLNKLKQVALASANQSLWQPGVVGGAPSTIDGDPYTVNQDMATMADYTKSVLYGDFKKFYIRDVMDLSIRRSDEINMTADQVVFVGFLRTDSGLMDTSAVKHMLQIVT